MLGNKQEINQPAADVVLDKSEVYKSRLEQYARQLAGEQQIRSAEGDRTTLVDHINNQEARLQAAYSYFRNAPAELLSVSYAAEWLLDNFYFAQQTLRQIREDLPLGYYRQLPKLASGPLQGYPRVYELARQFILYERVNIEPERLRQFLLAYQGACPLTMGELWALPIMLRLGILVDLAQALARIIDVKIPADVREYRGDREPEKSTWVPSPPEAFPPLNHPAEVDEEEIVANSFLSLRRISVQDWDEFFEIISQVEQTLRCDPAGVYDRMDFETRDHYRKSIERLARLSNQNEVEIARLAVELAQGAQAGKEEIPVHNLQEKQDTSLDQEDWTGLFTPRDTHVGYYLVNAGLSQLETRLGYRPGIRQRIGRWILRHPTTAYLGGIFILSLALLWGVLRYAVVSGSNSVQLFGIGVLGLVPTVTVAVGLVNLLVTRLVPPRILPKMDFSDGVPSSCTTMVVMPVLLSSVHDVKVLIERLELHYLQNPDPHLGFALLTDFSDAPSEVIPQDDELIEAMRVGIQYLNHRYVRPKPPFYFFHRKRLWNPREGVWMGWERKRGKLIEFNRLLSGAMDTSYSVRVGDLSILPDVRYVITLDADTVLPRGAAKRLIGTLAHPLNRARFDPASGKVISGYSLLQPRTEIKPTSANQTIFSRIYAGDTGLDLYTRAVSDVYQDLFGTGIYVGKGIYDVEAFQHILEGRVPENALLSHDLFEGIHAKVGLVTDIILYEDFPAHYLAYVLRLHRWVRGDWQLLPWLFPRIPVEGGRKEFNSLSGLDLWMILDNLRRSLLQPAIFAILVIGWIWLPGSVLIWTVAACLVPAIPLLTSFYTWAWKNLNQSNTWSLLYSIRFELVRWILSLIFLPYEALLLVDAIGLTLYRLTITRRGLLEWTPAAHTSRVIRGLDTSRQVWRQMSYAAAVVFGLGILIALVKPVSLIDALPLLLSWLVSPLVVYWISRPSVRRIPTISDDQIAQLHRLARRTWLYFERFTGPEDQWLPPDHFQEAPLGKVVHHTSPTNIGFMLLSTLAASDLGYIGVLGLSTRLRSSLDTLEGMQRYRGHFMNWYDTRSLEILPPRYVSTVDSGNLAASLLVISQACQAIVNVPIFRWERWHGLLDTLEMLLGIIPGSGNSQLESQYHFIHDQLVHICDQIIEAKDRPEEWVNLIFNVIPEQWETVNQQLLLLVRSDESRMDLEDLHALRLITDRIHHHLYSMQREIGLLLPWLEIMRQPPRLFFGEELNPSVSSKWQAFIHELPNTTNLVGIDEDIRAIRVHLQELKNQLIEELQLQTDESLQEIELQSSPHDPVKQATIDFIQEAVQWCDRLAGKLEQARLSARALTIGFEAIWRQAERYFQEMDFGFLYDSQRHVFHIGFNVETGQLDSNYYDLLASEACLTSLIAVATGQVPQSHWLHLARPFTRINGRRSLLSWSATMFEYLMPALLMKTFEDSLLHQTYLAVIDRQMDYAAEKKIPWGISESGFYSFDASQNYQYRAFGVPGLGFKRGLAQDLVVSPYASILALPFRPHALMDNLEKLDQLGLFGLYGFYESIDFTPSRMTPGQKDAVVRSFMAHHQGMILIALANYLLDGIMIQRFHADVRVRSVELLLQELVPQWAPLENPHPTSNRDVQLPATQVTATPWSVPVDTPMPQLHTLSNGRFTTVLSNAGGGFLRFEDIDLTRWRADTTLDGYGLWLYVQDLADGALWSAAYQPAAVTPENQEVQFFPHAVEFNRRDRDISLTMRVVVPPEDDLELRYLTLVNHSDRPRRLMIMSYAEVVLASQAVDQRHPAFNKLFIESEYLTDVNGLLFQRRARSSQERPIYLLHCLVQTDGEIPERLYESDRACFIGRGRTVRFPAAFIRENVGQSGASVSHRGLAGNGAMHLSETTGATLDPIMALGCVVELPPHGTSRVAYVTIASRSRQAVLDQAARYHSWSLFRRGLTQSRAHLEAEMRRLNINAQLLEHIQQLLSLLLLPYRSLRGETSSLLSNRKGQSGLWGFSISGDYPVLFVRVNKSEDTALLGELLRAHSYWRDCGIKIDLVILNQREAGYTQELTGQLHRLISSLGSENRLYQRGGIFLLRKDQMSNEDRALLDTVARVNLDGENGLLGEQLQGLLLNRDTLPVFAPVRSEPWAEATPQLERPGDLIFDNGLGGFSPDGREYVIYLSPGTWTPAPWVNVIANDQFGFLVSETGSSCTWAVNSGENRLTPWSNDPVSDPSGEALYLRDEETGEVWSPTPLPARDAEAYLIRHGAGYSTFVHHSHGLKQNVHMFCVKDAPVKVIRLTVENTWSHIRRITATYYVEWVLGLDHANSQMFVFSEFDSQNQSLLVRNAYNTEFGDRVAFLTSDHDLHGLTADRTEFLGRMGNMAAPAALGRVGLSGLVEAGTDPCGAIQVHLNLQPGETAQVNFLLGQGEDRHEALELIQRFRQPDQVTLAWEDLLRFWDDLLGTVVVQTPDPAMDVLLNRWLLYQTLSCRLWGRSAFYQSSGAYGYRDQLQDVMGVTLAAPSLAREHLLQAAAHQFESGDVLHWWHPPSGRGVRTRISDDLCWLPYVTTHYIAVTGDAAILDEKVPFLVGAPLEPDENERYGQYSLTKNSYRLYEHCRRALERGATVGPHGLPLMGTGDWNDGMNAVGAAGQGESVWLGWFLCKTLDTFADLCEGRGDLDQAALYRKWVNDYRKALEAKAWDGAWYRRAYYDDGSLLGSVQNQECQIDSIAQSWAVLSEAGDQERASQAMESVLEHLVRWDDRLILLFSPPFDHTRHDPGYIRGYPPGVRENGGQYTHAALWSIWAFSRLGQGDRAASLFRLINPIYQADTSQKVLRYKVEPYVIAADIYNNPLYRGQGGWTWYTGSSGWMYRLGIEAILGFKRIGEQLGIDPCIPKEWQAYRLQYRNGNTTYLIEVENPDGLNRGVHQIYLDGERMPGRTIPLLQDGTQHEVRVVMGSEKHDSK